MKTVKLGMSFDDPAEVFNLCGTFSTTDLGHLREYCHHATVLRQTKVIQEGYPKSINLIANPQPESQVDTEELDEEYISSFIHKLRPLILSKEPSSFEKVSGLIGRGFAHLAMKRHLKAVRKGFQSSRFSDFFQISVGDISIFDEETLNLWLNAFEFHQDPEKKAALEDALKTWSFEGLRRVFVSRLVEKAHAIFRLEDLARSILDYPDGGEHSI
jgi:hypothetical protein